MAFNNVYPINVDIKRRLTSVVPTFKQGDNGGLKFKIYDNGRLFDLSNYTHSEITFKLPNGESLVGNPELIDGELVYYFNRVEMAVVGKVETVLSIMSGDSMVSLQPFTCFIFDSMKNENLSYVGILQDLIKETQNQGLSIEGVLHQVGDTLGLVGEELDELHQYVSLVERTELIRNTNENTRQSNEQDRLNSEIQRIRREDIRVSNESTRVNAEDVRIQNESTRQSNETQRQNRFTAKIDEFEGKINILDEVKAVPYHYLTTYRPPNFVTYNGSTYIVLQTVTGVTPTDDGINYRLAAQRGVDGTGSVSTINGIAPNENGDVELSFVSQEFIDHERNETNQMHIAAVTSIPTNLANAGIIMKVDGAFPTAPEMPTLDQFEEDVREILDDYSDNIQSFQSQVTQQLAQIVVDITTFGAKDDVNFNSTEAIRAASAVANTPNHVLLIPDGKFYIDDAIDFHCNIDCRGTLVVPNNIAKTFVRFPQTDKIVMSGTEAFNSLVAGSVFLDLKDTTTLKLEEYYYTITSTELLIERMGGLGAYTKNEGGEIRYVKNGRVMLKTPILYTYNDLSKVTLTLHKKQKEIDINNLKIERISKGTNNVNQILTLINRNNVNLNKFSIDNLADKAVSAGLKVENTCMIRLNTPSIKNIYGVGDYYALLNMNTTFMYIDGFEYTEELSAQTNPRRGYNARHGNYVYFKNCTLYGIDDHWGTNYFIDNCILNENGINIAGGNVEIVNSKFVHCEYAYRTRVDTPTSFGELKFKNCVFDSCRYIVHFQVTAGNIPESYAATMKWFNSISFDDVIVKNSDKHVNVMGNYYSKGLIHYSTNVTNATIMETTRITFNNVSTDIPFIFAHNSNGFTIDEIVINRCRFTNLAVDRRGFYFNQSSTTRIMTVKKIAIIESDNLSGLITNLVNLLKLLFIRCEFTNPLDTSTSYYLQSAIMFIEFNNCLITETARFTITNKVGFKQCTFTGVRSNAVVDNSSALMYAKGNIGELQTLKTLAPIDDYLNATYYH